MPPKEAPEELGFREWLAKYSRPSLVVSDDEKAAIKRVAVMGEEYGRGRGASRDGPGILF